MRLVNMLRTVADAFDCEDLERPVIMVVTPRVYDAIVSELLTLAAHKKGDGVTDIVCFGGMYIVRGGESRDETP